MEKPSPIWQDLPRHLKIYIAGKLGDKSRSSLARCSKADLEITQAIPFNIKSITIVALDEIAWVYHVTTYAYQSKRVLMGATNAINTFLNFFKHPKSKVGLVTFELNLNNNYTTITQQITTIHILSKIKSENIKIRSKKFCVERSASFVSRKYLEVLELFDVKTLKKIEIFPIINVGFLNLLVHTEQWKNSIGVSICAGKFDEQSLNGFLHLNRINIRGSNVWTDENKDKLKENFISRDLPVNSFFFLYNFSAPNPMFTGDRPHEEKFDMPTRGNKLKIRMFLMKCQGIVISETKDDDNLNIDQLLYCLHT